jgi:oxygen-independent coproporphyrinogen-3 oxidase
MAGSLYIHVPFCRRKCLYCDFYSAVYDASAAGHYVDALCAQIGRLEERFDTVYVGGGTPTTLDGRALGRLLRSLSGAISARGEFTVEANPESFDAGKAALLRDSGVNRISIGVQSLDDRKLRRLGRIHNARAGADAAVLAAKNGFGNVSIDLIYGVWQEEPGRWKAELEEACALPVTHVSAYSLSYEKGTPLFDAVRNGSVEPLDDGAVAAMYEAAIDALSLRGLKQYEVSNFARDGFRSAHNLNYWNNGPYTGLGASAVSYAGGVRTKNVADIAEYVRRAGSGEPLGQSSEKLSAVRRAKETAAVKIRTKDGVDFAWFRAQTGFDFMELEAKPVASLVEQGLVRFRRDGASVTGVELKRKGFLFCDTVSSALL